MNKENLRVAMIMNHDTQEQLAEALSLPVSAINARINGKIDFRVSEVSKIVARYNLSPEETTAIFFDNDAS